MNLDEELQKAQQAATQHFNQWQQDLGAINLLRHLMEKEKEEKAADPIP